MVGFSALVIPLVYLLFLVFLGHVVSDNKLIKIKNTKILVLIIVAVGLLVISLYFYFNLQDVIRYSNYSFSTYFVYLPSLKFYAYFQILILVVGFFSYWFARFDKWRNLLRAENVIVIIFASVIPLVIFNMITEVPNYFKDEYIIYKTYIVNPKKNQNADFPSLSKQLDFIIKNTPENSAIIHPTQSGPFPLIGNQPLIRHGLYPRTLVSAKFAEEYLKENGYKNVFIIYTLSIDSEADKTSIHPKFEIDNVRIHLLYKDGRTESVILKKYSPNDWLGKKEIDIGLIEKL